MKKVVTLGKFLLLAVAGLITVAPVLFLLGGSLMGDQELAELLAPAFSDSDGYAAWHWLPLYPTLRHYVQLCLDSPEYFQMFWNTMKITVGVLAGQIIVGIPGAWGLARYSFPGKRAVYLLYILLMLLPFQVTMLSEYLVLDRFHLLDTLWAVILPGAFSTFPVFLMYRFFCSIPEEMLEAARIDGAGEWKIFIKIGLPMGTSGILSALVLQCLECFSMIEQPMVFLKYKKLQPLSLYLPQLQKEHLGFTLCSCFVTMIPALLIFGMGQRYMEQGITEAAVKE